MKYGLGRRFAPDNRDMRYLLRTVTAEQPRPTKKTWRVWWKGDQGQTPKCVGYAWHGLMRALPKLQREPGPDVIYDLAQDNDEWEGNDYDGSSVRGGAKGLQSIGVIKEYRWARSVEEALNWMGNHGPVVFGTNWYRSMFKPDSKGIIKIAGPIDGGHAYVGIGYDDTEELVCVPNSWGKGWSINGRCWIHYADLDRLIKEDGEACAPTE